MDAIFEQFDYSLVESFKVLKIIVLISETKCTKKISGQCIVKFSMTKYLDNYSQPKAMPNK